MEVQCIKVRIHPERIAEARQWLEMMNERGDETLELIQEEGIAIESVFVEENDDGMFLYQYVRAPSLQAAHEAFQSSENPMAAETQRFVERTWVEASPLTLVADYVPGG
jgi:hypothetical protein